MATTARLNSSEQQHEISARVQEYCDLVVEAGLVNKLEKIRLALEKKNAPVLCDRDVRRDALLHAITVGDVKLFGWLLDLDDYTKMDPPRLAELLEHAIKSKKEDMAVYLLEHTHVDMTSDKAYDLMRLAAASGMVKVVHYFIMCGEIEYSKLDRDGWDLLCHAASRGQIDMLIYLIKKMGMGYKVHLSYGNNGQLLHIAALYGQLDAVKWLVEEAKADVFAVDKWGARAENYARAFCKQDMVEYLTGKRLQPLPSKVCRQSLPYIIQSVN